jgi:hypothetical protein
LRPYDLGSCGNEIDGCTYDLVFGRIFMLSRCNNTFVRSWAKCKRKILEILSLLQTIMLSSVAESLIPACVRKREQCLCTAEPGKTRRGGGVQGLKMLRHRLNLAYSLTNLCELTMVITTVLDEKESLTNRGPESGRIND